MQSQTDLYTGHDSVGADLRVCPEAAQLPTGADTQVCPEAAQLPTGADTQVCPYAVVLPIQILAPCTYSLSSHLEIHLFDRQRRRNA